MTGVEARAVVLIDGRDYGQCGQVLLRLPLSTPSQTCPLTDQETVGDTASCECLWFDSQGEEATKFYGWGGC